MAELAAIKFNAETDPSRPKIGAEVKKGRTKYVIREVGHCSPSIFLPPALGGKLPDKQGHDEVLFERHPTRPFVYWQIWVDKIKHTKREKK